jgi:hypothetical protein
VKKHFAMEASKFVDSNEHMNPSDLIDSPAWEGAGLLARAKDMKKSKKFVFNCYSELNIIVLLRLEREIFELQRKAHDDNYLWSGRDGEKNFDNLCQKLGQYCNRQRLFWC